MDTRTDNKESQMEPAEGSRENVNLGQPDPALSGGDAGAPMERGAGQVSHPERPLENPGGRAEAGTLPRGYPEEDADDAGGITNRPLSEEKQNQRELPTRGRARGEEGE